MSDLSKHRKCDCGRLDRHVWRIVAILWWLKNVSGGRGVCLDDLLESRARSRGDVISSERGGTRREGRDKTRVDEDKFSWWMEEGLLNLTITSHHAGWDWRAGGGMSHPPPDALILVSDPVKCSNTRYPVGHPLTHTHTVSLQWFLH